MSFRGLFKRAVLLGSGILSGAVLNVAIASAGDNGPVLKADYFAVVGGEPISMQEFEAAYQAGVRKRFYHGKIPEDQLKAFKNEVSETLIERALLVQAARKAGVTADSEAVEKQLAQYEQRYSRQPHWQQQKGNILPGLKAALEEESMLQRYEEKIKTVENPGDTQVRSYYEQHPELFTTPEQVRLSLILLKVAPSSPADVWNAARDEAGQLIEKLKNGADFSQLARIHSGDTSAASGGDMGFLHKGMLAGPAQQVIDKLNDGDISSPVNLLTGIAIFRLQERRTAQLNDFENVAKRAQQLLVRELREQAWKKEIDRLRSTVEITVRKASL